jgi:3-phosphoshikimate 1-carboxyvinyltransferase
LKVHLEICQKDFDASLNVPGSKSISNRILIFQALSDSNESIENISTAKDTLVLQEAIQSTAVNIDVGDSGTAFRFLTSYYSVNSKTITLTGSARMKKRSINDLVNALRLLGADID